MYEDFGSGLATSPHGSHHVQLRDESLVILREVRGTGKRGRFESCMRVIQGDMLAAVRVVRAGELRWHIPSVDLPRFVREMCKCPGSCKIANPVQVRELVSFSSDRR